MCLENIIPNTEIIIENKADKNNRVVILCLYFIESLAPLYLEIIIEPPIDNPNDIEVIINIIEALFPNATTP